MINIYCYLTIYAATSAFNIEIDTAIPSSIVIPVGQAKFYDDTWTIVSTLEIKDIVRQSEILRTKMLTLENECLSNQCPFLDVIRNMLKRLDAVDEKKEILIGGVKEKRHARVKRGLFNVIGIANKYLFGTLDQSDADYYNSEIDKLYSNANEISSIVRNQTIFIKETVKDFTHHTSELITKVDRLGSVVFYLTNLAILQFCLIEYANVVRDLLLAISIAKSGSIIEILLSPEKLQGAINELKREYKYHNMYLDNNFNNYHTFLQLGEVITYMNGSRIVSKLELPILQKDTHDTKIESFFFNFRQ